MKIAQQLFSNPKLMINPIEDQFAHTVDIFETSRPALLLLKDAVKARNRGVENKKRTMHTIEFFLLALINVLGVLLAYSQYTSNKKSRFI